MRAEILANSSSSRRLKAGRSAGFRLDTRDHAGHIDAESPESLAALVGELRRHGKPFVFTVHQLRNPRHRDGALHTQQLDVLVPAADRLITFTAGAAAAIERRWGRRPLVLPYPHVVEPPVLVRRRPAHRGFTVGVHGKDDQSVRCLPALLDVLARSVDELPGAQLRVDLLPRTARVEGIHGPALQHLQDSGRLAVRTHDRLTDGHWWAYLLERPYWRGDLRERAAERQWLALAHRQLYENLVASAAPAGSW